MKTNRINLYIYFLLFIIIDFTLSSCSGANSKFKGTWEYSYSDEDSECSYTLWLDPSGKKVNQARYENVIGVIRSYEDAGGQSGTSYNQLTEFSANGNIAEIKYIHKETGEIHKAKLTIDETGTKLHWEYEGLYKTGLNSPKEESLSPAEGPSYLEPSDVDLDKSSKSPNHKKILPEYIIKELPECTYYIEDGVFSDQDEDGNWWEHAQLRCYNSDSGEDCVIFDETYLWGGYNPINISDVWITKDNKWLYFTLWSGGTEFQTITLYKTNGNSKAVLIDEVDGLRYNPLNEVTAKDEPSIMKENDKIVVYDPSKKETRTYDL